MGSSKIQEYNLDPNMGLAKESSLNIVNSNVNSINTNIESKTTEILTTLDEIKSSGGGFVNEIVASDEVQLTFPKSNIGGNTTRRRYQLLNIPANGSFKIKANLTWSTGNGKQFYINMYPWYFGNINNNLNSYTSSGLQEGWNFGQSSQIASCIADIGTSSGSINNIIHVQKGYYLIEVYTQTSFSADTLSWSAIDFCFTKE